MALARPVIKGRIYLLTRRCSERRFLLRRGEKTNQAVTYCLAEAAQRVLFGLEDELGVGAYFWYRLIHWIGDMADYAEKVGNRLRLLIAS